MTDPTKKEIDNMPHKEVDVDFPLSSSIKRSEWGNKAWVYVPPKEFGFFAICNKANEGLKKESVQSFVTMAYAGGNDDVVHVSLPYTFSYDNLYKQNVTQQVVQQGDMLAVVVHHHYVGNSERQKIPLAPDPAKEPPVVPDASEEMFEDDNVTD